VQRDAEGQQTRKPPIVDVMGHRGGRGAHLPYLVNATGNPWVKKFDPYPSSRGTGGFRAVWMMFERLHQETAKVALATWESLSVL